MWKPSPMSIYKFEPDIECIATDPSWDHGRVTWAERYPEIAGYTQAVNLDLDPWHGLREAVGTVDRNLQAELVRRARVADQDDWRLRIDVVPEGILVVARVKTWPAIPGFTSPLPAEDQP